MVIRDFIPPRSAPFSINVRITSSRSLESSMEWESEQHEHKQQEQINKLSRKEIMEILFNHQFDKQFEASFFDLSSQCSNDCVNKFTLTFVRSKGCI